MAGMRLLLLLAVWLFAASGVDAFAPRPGANMLRFTLTPADVAEFAGVEHVALNGTRLFMRLHCAPLADADGGRFSVQFALRTSACENEFSAALRGGRGPMAENRTSVVLARYFTDSSFRPFGTDSVAGGPQLYFKSEPVSYTCDGHGPIDVTLPTEGIMDVVKVEKRDATSKGDKGRGSDSSTSVQHAAFTLPADAVYFMIARVALEQPAAYSANMSLEVRWLAADDGYLSAVDRPLLTFFAAMCILYVVYALAWALMCGLRWKDLLQFQFCIGAVILLGMVEKAAFYAEYETVNAHAYPVFGVIQLAETVSCVKRTLARLLVIVASLGFGVVRPRLGADLNKLIAVGLIYFVLASVEANVRVARSLGYATSERRMAGLPLVIVEVLIFWWACTSLAGTMRALKLRKNAMKLGLYRHFTNTLIFAAAVSAVFMLWSLWRHALAKCVTDWRQMWVDVAFWHVLFSAVLLVIMILWRPSKNDQRYAFAPLVNEDSEDDDVIFTGAFVTGDAMKLRPQNGPDATLSNRNQKERANDAEEDLQRELRWVEENIPSSLADQLVADSDEEAAQTRFEVAKMQ